MIKANPDTPRAILYQDRDKTSSSNSPITTELKDISDSILETQSDKENSSCKITSSIESLTCLSSSNTTAGYDSDTSKPVKVKSRWRRSSELEMGGSSSFQGSRIGTDFRFSAGVISGSGSTTETNTEPGTDEDTLTSGSLVKVENIGIASSPPNMENMYLSSETRSDTTSPVTTEVSKIVGAKIFLPMVLEEKDREMEERLSQFENLKENLYLTERFVNQVLNIQCTLILFLNNN